MNVVAVFEEDYDPTYVNLTGYIEVESPNKSYKVSNCGLIKRVRSDNDIRFSLQGTTISGGTRKEFTPIKLYFNSGNYDSISIFAVLEKIGAYSLNNGSLVIINKKTGEIIPHEYGVYKNITTGVTNIQVITQSSSYLSYDYLKENCIQDIEIQIKFWD